MATFFYRLSLWIYHIMAWAISPISVKAKKFIYGRSGWRTRYEQAFQQNDRPVIWFHCASLGEFEQGKPVMEGVRKLQPEAFILVTFYSPSGYDNRKNASVADYVDYLPTDNPNHAKLFVQIVQPKLALFVKYEFWHFYTLEMQRAGVPILGVSCIFRAEQAFFKWYGGFYRNILRRFAHFFVQNETSEKLLRKISINQVEQTGDTRFDRVLETVRHAKPFPEITTFLDGRRAFIAGSTWPDDMRALKDLIQEHRSWVYIIAPHEIKEPQLEHIERLFPGRVVRYSKLGNDENSNDNDVLLIDNIGMLSSLYQYGYLAYIGGAFNHGLHNMLEAAAFGLPIFFGNKNYKKFQEAIDLSEIGSAHAIANGHELVEKVNIYLNDEALYRMRCSATLNYMHKHTGATDKILERLQDYL